MDGKDRTLLFRHRDLCAGGTGHGGGVAFETQRENGGEAVSAEFFWKLMTIAALVWYSSVTIYVSIRGVTDIKEMSRHLGKQKKRE